MLFTMLNSILHVLTGCRVEERSYYHTRSN